MALVAEREWFGAWEMLLLYYLALAGVWKESSWLYNDITAICGNEESFDSIENVLGATTQR